MTSGIAAMRRTFAGCAVIIVRRSVATLSAAVAMHSVRCVRDIGSRMHRHAKQGGDQQHDEKEAVVHNVSATLTFWFCQVAKCPHLAADALCDPTDR